jgi:hypothetical protein
MCHADHEGDGTGPVVRPAPVSEAVGAETCATWPDAPLTAGCSAPRRLPGRGMIFGLWG